MWPYVRLDSRRQCTTAAGNPKHFSSDFFVKTLVSPVEAWRERASLCRARN
jgi:hypothetical protein